jgi:hypothetical protein
MEIEALLPDMLALIREEIKKKHKKIPMKHAIDTGSDAGAGHTIGHNYLLDDILNILK